MARSRRWRASSASARPPASSASAKRTGSSRTPPGRNSRTANPGIPAIRSTSPLARAASSSHHSSSPTPTAPSSPTTCAYRCSLPAHRQPIAARSPSPRTRRRYSNSGMKLVTERHGHRLRRLRAQRLQRFLGQIGHRRRCRRAIACAVRRRRPVCQPRAVCAVVLDKGQSGSIEAGPIARDIVLAAIKR